MAQSAINKISFAFPSFSLLTQTDQLSDNLFCEPDNTPEHCDDRRYCHCTQRVKINLNSVVEFVVIDRTQTANDLHHPFHMHGYGLTVTDMGKDRKTKMTVELYKELERTGQLPKAPEGHIPPIKDTITVRSTGYTVFRLKADNPGFWLIHCHFDHHLATGMTLLIQVGSPNDFPKVPNNFPKCNNFVPDLYEDVSEKSIKD